MQALLKTGTRLRITDQAGAEGVEDLPKTPNWNFWNYAKKSFWVS